jgi:SAM-dependent methyltransferase
MTDSDNQREMSIGRRLGRAILWPIRRFFDPRFEGIAAQVAVSHNDHVQRLGDVSQRLSETAGQTHESLAHLQASVEELDRLGRADLEMATDATTLMGEAVANVGRVGDEILGIVQEMRHGAAAEQIRHLTGGTVDELDSEVAQLLNFAASHEGFAAQRSLWFNPPVSLSYQDGDVSVSEVNERAVELPYVLRALAAVPPGANVLDVGATESLLSLSLASLGYNVTAVDPRPYPLSHPRLEVVVAEVQDWEPNRAYDVIVCLSTIEHIGLGAYGEDKDDRRADLMAMAKIRDCTAPGGLLVLTTPFGSTSTDAFTRVYDRSQLDELLAGWEVSDLTIARRDGRTTWVVADDETDGGSEADSVALVTATRVDE